MFCYKCGNQIIVGARFCTKCGAPVRMATQPTPQNVEAAPQASQSVGVVPQPAQPAPQNVGALPQATPQNVGQVQEYAASFARIIPPGHMDLGNPVKKPKVSAYTTLPRNRRLLPLASLFRYYDEQMLVLGSDGVYYWISLNVLYAMTEDCIIQRLLSDEEKTRLGIVPPKESFAESVKGLLIDEINMAADTMTYADYKPIESDNTSYTYFEYQHIKKVKRDSTGRNLQFGGMYGGHVCMPPQHADFIFAYVSARI